MLAFEIETNENKRLVAGVEDWSILGLNLLAGRIKESYITCSAGALTYPDANNVTHHVRWPDMPLRIGSTLRIRIVDTPHVHEPIKRFRSDENPLTEEERKEMRYEHYLELKAEFEPGGTIT